MIIDPSIEKLSSDYKTYSNELRLELLKLHSESYSEIVHIYIYDETKMYIHQQLQKYKNQSIKIIVHKVEEILNTQLLMTESCINLLQKYINTISCEIIPPDGFIGSC